MRNVNFGTDGWRGIIADDFTVQNLRLVVQAIMSYIVKEAVRPKVAIGYDTRFLSEYFARRAAEVACGNGARVVISPVPVTTPMLSYAVHAGGSSGGIMVTASHNPYNYSGIKFKANYGGSATPGITSAIESRISKTPVQSVPYEDAKSQGGVIETGFFEPYKKRVHELLNTHALKGGGIKTAIDCMHGTAGYHAGGLWESLGLEINLLRKERDPYFGGTGPEPKESNLSLLSSEVLKAGCDIGIATDGDADRVGVVDGKGGYVSPSLVMALLLLHMNRNRGLTGMVVKTVSTSSLIDRIAGDLGLPVRETPVGFKHICELMLTEEVLIGGEENGGFGIMGHIPERDGLLSALLLIEMMAVEGRGLTGLLSEVEKKYGRPCYKRRDVEVGGPKREYLMQDIREKAKTVYDDFGVKEVKTFDGVKVFLGGGAWVLFRLSGTESLLRIYSEASDPVMVEKLINRGMEAFLG